MLRRTLRTTLVALSIVALSAAAGCKKKGEGKGGALEGGASGGLVLPADTGFMAGISFAKLRDSKLWAFAKEQGAKDPEFKGVIDEIKADCGIDVWTDIDTISVSGPASMDEKKMLIVVKGKFEEAKIGRAHV